MTDPGYWDQSYPPSLWAAPAQPVTAAARDTSTPAEDDASSPAEDDASRVDARQLPGGTVGTSPLTVTAGSPGTYEPAVSAAQRPRNVTELRSRATPAGRAPWPAGAYVLVGESGKRAHWTGEDWRGGESPGYVPESAADTPDVVFPGVDGSPQDQSR